MPRLSAGLLPFRRRPGHMGGPFWARKEAGAWSIPKGLVKRHQELILWRHEESAHKPDGTD